MLSPLVCCPCRYVDLVLIHVPLQQGLGQTVSSQQIQLHVKQQTIDSLTTKKEEQIQNLDRENTELKEGNARLSQESERNLTHIQSLEQQAAELHQSVRLIETDTTPETSSH